MTRYPKIFAIDYGTKRVGVAVSRGSLAEPLAIIANDQRLLEELQRLIVAEAPEKILVGLSENVMADLTRAFVEKLRTLVSQPIEFVDETLSSHSVHEKLLNRKKANGSRARGARAPIDHLAAAEFLQEYLDFSQS